MEPQAVIKQLRKQSQEILEPLVQAAIDDAASNLSRWDQTIDLASELLADREPLGERFRRYLGFAFDELTGNQSRRFEPGDYPSLSVVNDDYVEAANALEGMINYARNTNIKGLINLNTRLNELLSHLTVDETNSPLDPERIAEAFANALSATGVPSQQNLIIYRSFNQQVLHQLPPVLEKANELCIASGLLPELVVDGRSRETQLRRRSALRPSTSGLQRAFRQAGSADDDGLENASAQLYTLIRELIRSESTASGTQPEDQEYGQEVVVPAAVLTTRRFNGSLVSELGLLTLKASPDMRVAGREVVLVTRRRLTELLGQVQERLIDEVQSSGQLLTDHRRISCLLGEALLESSVPGTLNAIDGDYFDVLLITSLVFESICQDVSLVEPIKELIVATQVVVMKLAVNDPELFSMPGHPLRLLLNEVAAAGVGGLDRQALGNDPVFNKLESVLIQLVTEYRGETELVNELLDDFHRFVGELEPDAGRDPGEIEPNDVEYRQRICAVHDYVRTRIQERIREPLHPVVEQLVTQYFHQFLTLLVERDGQGTTSWLLGIKILDLLLWTVRSEKKEGDLRRFERTNPLLLPNIRKVLLIAGLDENASDSLLKQLEQVQKTSFGKRQKSVAQSDEIAVTHGTGTAGDGHNDASAARSENITAITGADRLFDNRKWRWPAQSDCQEQMQASLQAENSAAGILRSLRKIKADQPETLLHGDKLQSFLSLVDRLPIGSWLSFRMDKDRSLYCTLTARLQTVNRLVFVNGKGVKVVEKTREGLARELAAGTARLVSEAPLFERAMEAVVARLRGRRQQV